MRKQIKQNNGSQFNKKQTKQTKVINWFASVTLMFSVCLGASFSTLALNSEIKNYLIHLNTCVL